MAVDIVTVCEAATTHQSSQLLAIILAVLFSVYILLAIGLSAFSIYSSSCMRTVATKRTSQASDVSPLDILGSVPLVGVHR